MNPTEELNKKTDTEHKNHLSGSEMNSTAAKEAKKEIISELASEARQGKLKAFRKLESIAKNGDPNAQYEVGCLYLNGVCGKQDTAQAINCFTAAADNNENALKELIKLADNDYTDAINGLVELAKNGNKNAFDGLSCVAENDNEIAQYALGCLLLNGEGTEQDISKAIKYFKESANYIKNATRSLRYLATKGYNEALDALTDSANNGNPDSQYNLGCLYLEGKVVREDITQVINLFRKAAEGWNKSALHALINLSLDNNREAQYALGCIYLRGGVVRQDIKEAINWFKESASENRDAVKVLTLLAKNDHGDARIALFDLASKGNRAAFESLDDICCNINL